MAPPVVLVVDSDLGFIVSLSYELHYRGIESLPALTIGEARSMLRQFRREPDLLVIDCAVLGACTFAQGMAKVRPDMPIIGIVSKRNHCEDCANLLKATFLDPEDKEPDRTQYCANLIEALVRGQRSATPIDSP